MIRILALALISFGLCCSIAQAQSSVNANPSSSKSPLQRFPRISGLDDIQVQVRVNALLAKREEADRSERKDCLRTIMAGGARGEYRESIHVTYLSPRVLSIDVRSTYLCGAYPDNDISNPFTLDLVLGEELNWKHFFVDGFLDFADGKSSPLSDAYLKRAALDPDCRKAVNASAVTFDLWLDRSLNKLMVRPSLPHVMHACAAVVGIPFSELQASIRNPQDRQDLVTPPIGTHPTTAIPN